MKRREEGNPSTNMLDKKTYANGQKVYELNGDTLTYYFIDGTVKSKGTYNDEQMEGKWVFYRKTGELWQVGQFKGGQKHGRWIRYSRDGEIEYDEEFRAGKQIK